MVTKKDLVSNSPRVIFNKAHSEEDRFPDHSILQSLDTDQHDETSTDVQKMKHTSRENGLPKGSVSMLEQLLESYINIFRITLSSGTPAEIKP